jgi:hypothetical protein
VLETTNVPACGIPTYELRACSRALVAGSNPAPASGSQVATGSDRWLLMAVRDISGTPWTHPHQVLVTTQGSYSESCSSSTRTFAAALNIALAACTIESARHFSWHSQPCACSMTQPSAARRS